MDLNGATLHLITNHLPVSGTVFALIFIIVAYLSKSLPLQRAGLVFVAISCALSLPAYRSGEEAEDFLERYTVVQEELVEAHEELADKATLVSLLSGLFAVGAILYVKRRPEKTQLAVMATGVLVLVSSILLAMTAHRGGLIRHPELEGEKSGASQPGVNP